MTKQTIQTKKNYEILMDRLIDMIKSRNLKPGDKLDSIEKLATQFGVSRSVVREALSGLKAMGLVHIQQGEGTYIAKFDPATFTFSKTTALIMKKEDIKELLEVRKILEVGAVRLAAIKRTDEELKHINTTLNKMRNITELNEKVDYEFHYKIVRASHNKVLIHLLQSISELMIETIRNTLQVTSSEADKRKFLKDHERIFSAIYNRDPHLAEKYMLEHLTNVEQSLSPYII